MVRFVGFFVGLICCIGLFWGAVQPRDAVVETAHGYPPVKTEWAFNGPLGLGVFGTFDNRQLQRGYQVYKEVCSGCHSLGLIAFRNLREIGFSEAEVKALAKESEIATVDGETGEPATRPGLPSDLIPGPYPNEVAARAANNNALPPDLSLITKAREDGTNYVHSLLAKGYVDPPAGHEVPEGLYYNKYFANLNIAMPAPIAGDDQVTYADGTKATVEQMSTDVTAFLTWTAEPTLMARKETGLGVVIFLSILSILSYFTYRAVWADLKKKPVSAPAE